MVRGEDVLTPSGLGSILGVLTPPRGGNPKHVIILAKINLTFIISGSESLLNLSTWTEFQ